MPKAKGAKDKIEVEPGADKRLANILKRALNTPPARKTAAKKQSSRKQRG